MEYMLSGKNCRKLFIVSCNFASIQVLVGSVQVLVGVYSVLNIKYMVSDHALLHSYPTTDSNTSMGMICRRRRFWHATLRLRSAIRPHHPPQRAVLSQICCFEERKVVLFHILLDDSEPRDAGTTWLSSPVFRRGG